ncbi:MAG: class I SAM-dependent DNA methyltransferase [Polyangiaceae bacterium]
MTQTQTVATGSSPPSARTFASFTEATSFIWSVADLLRGDYKQADYGKVILPFTVLRRLDCVLKDSKSKVLEKHKALKGGKIKDPEPILNKVTGVPFHNVSKLDFEKLKDDPNHIAQNLTSYVKGFSQNARDIIERFKFSDQIAKLDESNLLYLVVGKFAEIDLHPMRVPNHVMGSIFEELIRRFSELSNETAGEHFTPREVIRLMVNLLFVEDSEALTKPGIVRTLYDPACGTGGMLSVAEEYLRELNPNARLEVFGQELNDESYAICKADMMIKGQNPENIKRGNSFSEDGHPNRKVDYLLSNPPFGVEWKKVEKAVRDEHDTQGHAGRFGAGLPRINDGSLLFLQHMVSKMKPADAKAGEGGSRLAIVLNGSPLFTGDAGSGESEIRRWIIENDWLEAARPALLQHGHQHLRLGRHEQEAQGAAGQGPAHQRHRLLPEDEEEPGQQAERAFARAHRRADADLLRRDRGQALQDLRQRRLRLPPHHGRAATAPELSGLCRASRVAPGTEGLREPRQKQEEGRGWAGGNRSGKGRPVRDYRRARPLAAGQGVEEPRRLRGRARQGASRGQGEAGSAGAKGGAGHALGARRDGGRVHRLKGQPRAGF